MKTLLAVLLICCGSVLAQTFVVKTITFEGAPQYASAELMRISGLALGSTYRQADLEAALGRLDASGLFASINYKTDGTALHIVLEPMAGTKAREIKFANFVMATPDELMRELKVKLPLFTGTVPVNGDLQQQIERGLEAILKERGVDARVTSIGSQGGMLDYMISSPQVVVGHVLVGGVDFNRSPSLAAVRTRFEGQEYVEGISGEALRSNLEDAYGDLGFVDFNAGPILHGPPAMGAARIIVDLTGTAQVGPLYTVGKLGLPAVAPGVSADEIAHFATLKVGAPASRIERLSTQARLNLAYADHGYLAAHTEVATEKNSSAHMMSYAYTTSPGPLYTFGEVRSSGLKPEVAEAVGKALKLSPGAVFEGARVRDMMQSTAARTGCSGRAVQAETVRKDATRQADIVLTCGR